MKKLITVLSLFVTLSPFVSAQEKVIPQGVGNTAMQFVCQPRTAAATAMAGIEAFDGADFFLRDTGRVELDVSYSMWERTASVASSPVNAVIRYKSRNFIGVSVDMHVDRMKSTIPTDENGDFQRNGQYMPSNLGLGLGVDFLVLPNVEIAAKARYLRSNFYLGQNFNAFSSDLTAAAVFGSFGVVAGVANLGPKVSGKYSLPTSALICATFEHKGIMAEVEGDYYFFGGIRLAAAASYTFKDIVTARVGYNMGKGTPLESFASAGLGVKVVGIQLNLAYLFSNNPLNGTASIGLNYKF